MEYSNNLHIIGNPGKRKRTTNYDPDLARRENEEIEAEERIKELKRKREELEAKIKKKTPQEQKVSTETSLISC